MNRYLVAPAAIAALLVGGASAWATPQLKLRAVQGASTATKTDALNTGEVAYNNKTLGAFKIASATGLGSPLLVEPGGYQIDLSGNVVATAVGTLSLALTETDLSQAPGSLPFQESFGGTLPMGWTITLDAYFDPTNKAFGAADLLYSYSFTATAPTPTSAFSIDANNSGLVSKKLFSITDIVTITATTTNHSASFDVTSTDLPEPASIALLGLGMGGLLVVKRRKP